MAPPTCLRPRLSARSDVTGCTSTPSCARRTWPSLRRSSMTWRAMFDGIAKPMPMFASTGESISALIPIDLALRVHERAARVAVVDRRVGLQEVLVAAAAVAIARSGRPALRADDPHRHRLADAERVADREHDVAHLRVVGVAERRGLQTRGVDFDEREVARLVGADHLRLRASGRRTDRCGSSPRRRRRGCSSGCSRRSS